MPELTVVSETGRLPEPRCVLCGPLQKQFADHCHNASIFTPWSFALFFESSGMNPDNGREKCRGWECQLLEHHCSIELYIDGNIL